MSDTNAPGLPEFEGQVSDAILIRLGQTDMALEDSPCATYLVRRDPDLTILCANSKFYQLLGLTPESLRITYGNRLGALMDAESLQALPSLALRQTAGEEPFFYLEQTVRGRPGGEEKWLNTSATLVEFNGESVYCCFSYDATPSVQFRRRAETLESIIAFVTNRIRYEMFVYDTHTGGAQVHTSQAALREHFPDSSVEFPNFLDTLISRGVIAPESHAAFLEMFDTLHRREEHTSCEIRLKTAGGEYMWVLFSLEFHSLRGTEGRYAIGIFEDITQQKEAMLNFLHETQFFQAMLSDTVAFGQLDVTEDRFLRCGGLWDLYNELVDRISYTQLYTEFINKVVHPEDRKHYLELMNRDNFFDSLQNGVDKLGCEFRRIVEQNKMVWMSISINLFQDSMTGHVMALLYLKNIDQEKKRQLSLLHDSERDHLTNIYSKKMAEVAIRSYLMGVRADEICVLLMLDIDSFRAINSTHGHETGDEVLVTLSTFLSQTFRKNDIIGRYGGDEFILFIKNISSMERIKKRLDALYAQIHQQAKPAFTVSTGVAPVVGSAAFEDLFHRAGTALSAAKESGKNCYIFFDGQHMTDPGAYLPTPEETPSECLLPKLAVTDSATSVMPFDAYIAKYGDIAYLVDVENYALLYGNTAFYDRVGRTPEQCIGKTCYEVMQGRKTPCPFCSNANWSTDKFYLWRNFNQFLEQEFLLKNKLIQWEGREVMLAIAVDISNNKSIVDSMDNGVSESHALLSGIQGMAEAHTLSDAMTRALETISTFFRADSAQLWECPSADSAYRCAFSWYASSRKPPESRQMTSAVDSWLRGRKWSGPLLIETPDMMLSYSYDMYQHMKRCGVQNSLCVPLIDSHREYGCLMVQNISANFRNVSFIKSFSGFIISERKRRDLIAEILYAGTHDTLTNLFNRNSYDQLLHQYDSDEVSSLGIVFADFDGLKGINALRGYHVGNDLLTRFSSLLLSIFPSEKAYRLNGDEFLVVAPNISQTDLDDRVRALRNEVSRNGQFSVSVGHCWDNIEKNLAVMVENATQMMHINKKRHYDADKDANNAVRSNMLQELMTSLERRRFEIFLQPKVAFEDHRVVGAEALVRYRDKRFGIIPPAQFIDMMERNDFIRYVDLFVFEEVCSLLHRWKKQGLELPKISLNFSRLTLLESDLVSSVESIFSRYDVPKACIEIEVTESFAEMGKGVLSQSVGGLYQSGFSISLDDFGTKYTNLALLSDFEFNVLKLDKSLISALVDEERNQIVLKSVIEMCGSLGIDVIAEGVETQEQEDILRMLGCLHGQGYLYGRPVEVSEYEKLYMPCTKIEAGV